MIPSIKKKKDKEEKKLKGMKALRDLGFTYREIGKRFEMSKQGAHQRLSEKETLDKN